ncbi:hypothetical protein D3C73_686790 [compost metagenome]
MRNLLQHTHLATDGVADITVAAEAWRLLSHFGQTGRGATEQLGASAHRVEQIVAAQEIFLTQFNAVVRARHIVVSGVVAALGVLLAQTNTPGGVLADYAIGVRVIEVVVQGVGFFNLVAGLSKSKAGEVVVGRESRGACAQNRECQKQFFESSHWGVSSCADCFLGTRQGYAPRPELPLNAP